MKRKQENVSPLCILFPHPIRFCLAQILVLLLCSLDLDTTLEKRVYKEKAWGFIRPLALGKGAPHILLLPRAFNASWMSESKCGEFGSMAYSVPAGQG